MAISLTTVFDADGDNTAQAGATGAANLYAFEIYNSNSTFSFVQFYDLAAGSVTVGTTTPLFTIPIPPQGAVEKNYTNPKNFSTALTYACTTTPTGSGDPSTGLVLNLSIRE